MKRITSILIVAVMLMACMAPAVFAAGPAVTTEAVTAHTGDTVDVAVSITGNTGFKAYGLQVEYDEAALELTEVKAGEKSNGFFDANLENGKVAFAAAESMTGDGVLFTLSFKVKAVEVKKYDVKVVWDAQSSDLAVAPAMVDGAVSVVCANHVWNDGEVTAQPDCDTAGEKTFTCTVPGCGETKTEPVAATGHAYGDYVADGNATCDKDGTKTATCANCGHKDTVTDEGSATGHKFENGVCVNCGEKNPTTGDSSTTVLWMALMVASIGACALVASKKNKACAE